MLLDDITQVDTNYLHVVAPRTDGTVLAWGYNQGGEVGDGTQLDRPTPVRVKAGKLAPAPYA